MRKRGRNGSRRIEVSVKEALDPSTRAYQQMLLVQSEVLRSAEKGAPPACSAKVLEGCCDW